MADDWKQRFMAEYTELGDRLVKLGRFIGSDPYDELPKEDQALLKIQYRVMRSYQEVMTARLERFK